jgi:hypothetical protein
VLRQLSGVSDGRALFSRLRRAWFSETLLSALRASHFLLLRQKKVSKEKATPGSAPAAPVPCATRQAGRLAKLAFGSNNASRLPPAYLRCSAPLRGTRKASGLRRQRGNWNATVGPKKCQKLKNPSSATDGLPGPLRGAEQRRKAGGLRRGLFEGRSPEFRSRPACRVAQGTGVAGADPGSPFLWLLSFGEAKESTPAPQARKTQLEKTPPPLPRPDSSPIVIPSDQERQP